MSKKSLRYFYRHLEKHESVRREHLRELLWLKPHIFEYEDYIPDDGGFGMAYEFRWSEFNYSKPVFVAYTAVLMGLNHEGTLTEPVWTAALSNGRAIPEFGTSNLSVYREWREEVARSVNTGLDEVLSDCWRNKESDEDFIATFDCSPGVNGISMYLSLFDAEGCDIEAAERAIEEDIRHLVDVWFEYELRTVNPADVHEVVTAKGLNGEWGSLSLEEIRPIRGTGEAFVRVGRDDYGT